MEPLRIDMPERIATERLVLRMPRRGLHTLEALLRSDSLTPIGEPRSTRVYARVRGAEEPMGPVA
jgi:hypothetical protein